VAPTVVLVGLDGADRTEIERLADAGDLPVIAGMRAAGVWGAVEAFDGLGDDAAWCSFATGVGPGRHGRRYHRHYRLGTYEMTNAERDEIGAAPFRGALAGHSLRVAVRDVPKSPLGDDRATLVVADWMSHGAPIPEVIGSTRGQAAVGSIRNDSQSSA
jgi:predicted AlkP superfamily phosphohydrolase/phosphomutase